MDEFYSNENCFLTADCVLFRHFLRGAEMIICPFFRHQFIVGTELFHPAVIEEQNMVCETYRGEPVGDDDPCMLFNIR